MFMCVWINLFFRIINHKLVIEFDIESPLSHFSWTVIQLVRLKLFTYFINYLRLGDLGLGHICIHTLLSKWLFMCLNIVCVLFIFIVNREWVCVIFRDGLRMLSSLFDIVVWKFHTHFIFWYVKHLFQTRQFWFFSLVVCKVTSWHDLWVLQEWLEAARQYAINKDK